jgi:hypothetical protein
MSLIWRHSALGHFLPHSLSRCQWQDLNPRSQDFESRVLPLCYWGPTQALNITTLIEIATPSIKIFMLTFKNTHQLNRASLWYAKKLKRQIGQIYKQILIIISLKDYLYFQPYWGFKNTFLHIKTVLFIDFRVIMSCDTSKINDTSKMCCSILVYQIWTNFFSNFELKCQERHFATTSGKHVI